VTIFTIGNNTAITTVDCAANNGNCEQVCVPNQQGSTIGHCACFSSAYQLQPNGLKCEDVNECNATTPVCPNNTLCLNSVGSYTCVTLDYVGAPASAGQTAAEVSDVDYQMSVNASYSLEYINNKFDPVSEQASTIRIIFFSLIGWIVLITLVLIVVAIASYRFWRRDRSDNILDTSSVRSRSESVSGSLRDLDTERKVVPPSAPCIDNVGYAGSEISTGSSQGFSVSAVRVHQTSTVRCTQPGLASVASLDETSSVFHAPVRF